MTQAQVFVRSVPPSSQTGDAPPREIVSTDELDGVAPAAKPSVSPAAPSSEDTNRLVEQYRREAGPLGPSKLFSLTKWDLYFGVGVAYDDNIRTSTGTRKQSDEITILSGGVSLSLGDAVKKQNGYLNFSYSAAENLFAVHSSEDAFDQDALLDARYVWGRLSVELMSNFRAVHDPVSDTAERERRYLFDEALTFQYRYGDKTFLQSRFSYDRSDPAFAASNQQYAWENAADYLITSKIKLGVGLVVGRLEIEDVLGETFGQPLARFQYQVTDKVSVLAQAGADFRYRGGNSGQMITPVFALEGIWTPDDDTTLSVSGFRRVDASESITGGQYVNSTVGVTARRRFLRKYYVLANASYTHGDYENVSNTTLPSREDDYFLLRGGLGYHAAKYLDLGLFYLHQRNDSSLAKYAFTSNRVYLQSNVLF